MIQQINRSLKHVQSFLVTFVLQGLSVAKSVSYPATKPCTLAGGVGKFRPCCSMARICCTPRCHLDLSGTGVQTLSPSSAANGGQHSTKHSTIGRNHGAQTKKHWTPQTLVDRSCALAMLNTKSSCPRLIGGGTLPEVAEGAGAVPNRSDQPAEDLAMSTKLNWQEAEESLLDLLPPARRERSDGSFCLPRRRSVPPLLYQVGPNSFIKSHPCKWRWVLIYHTY